MLENEQNWSQGIKPQAGVGGGRVGGGGGFSEQGSNSGFQSFPTLHHQLGTNCHTHEPTGAASHLNCNRP